MHLFALATLAAFTGHAVAQSRVPVTSAVFDNLAYYARFAYAAGLSPDCKNPPNNAVVEGYVNTNTPNIPNTDIHATLFRIDSRRELVLAWAGSNNTANLILDLSFVQIPYTKDPRCDKCSVHAGFLVGYESAYSMVQTQLPAALAKHPGYKLTIAGASLGAALASLNFANISSTYAINAVYTYGEPRVGNKPFADFIDRLAGSSDSATNPGKYFRTTHAGDPVPRVPATNIGYWHSRNEYWEMDSFSPSVSSTFRCFGQEPTDCLETGGQFNAEDHLSYAGYTGTTC